MRSLNTIRLFAEYLFLGQQDHNNPTGPQQLAYIFVIYPSNRSSSANPWKSFLPNYGTRMSKEWICWEWLYFR